MIMTMMKGDLIPSSDDNDDDDGNHCRGGVVIHRFLRQCFLSSSSVSSGLSDIVAA